MAFHLDSSRCAGAVSSSSPARGAAECSEDAVDEDGHDGGADQTRDGHRHKPRHEDVSEQTPVDGLFRAQPSYRNHRAHLETQQRSLPIVWITLRPHTQSPAQMPTPPYSSSQIGVGHRLPESFGCCLRSPSPFPVSRPLSQGFGSGVLCHSIAVAVSVHADDGHGVGGVAVVTADGSVPPSPMQSPTLASDDPEHHLPDEYENAAWADNKPDHKGRQQSEAQGDEQDAPPRDLVKSQH
ncbi:hypothetical protein F7725_015484 [Dissostichus mawsoni]|uniref:Uncharacterized protein n=1 Tax=Dissostichus mawsoni TaxID=36200 RepID=A0A7J5YKH2_DISMA|nr:hypothetical protein F7725_015484 [Dissostichus mawsoni]